MVAVPLEDEKKSRKTEKSSTKTKEIKRGSLLREAPASSPSNVSPAPHPLYLLHYAIKSVITILADVTDYNHAREEHPHLLFQLPSLIPSDKGRKGKD
jgi:hypothetical protein